MHDSRDFSLGSFLLLTAVSGIALAQHVSAQAVVLGWQVPAQPLQAEPIVASEQFGNCMAMSSDGVVMVIGAPNTRVDSLNGVGAIHIFEFDAATGWSHVQKIEAPPAVVPGIELERGDEWTAPSFAQFGAAVAIDERTIVVGSWGYAPAFGPGAGVFSGRAFVFTRKPDGFWGVLQSDGSSWPDATLKAGDLAMLDLFGFAVAVDVDVDGAGVIAVGKTLDGTSNTGATYLFSGSAAAWTQTAKLTRGGNMTISDQFGSKLAIDLPTVAVGVQNADGENGSNAGAISLFTASIGSDGSLVWPLVPSAEIISSDGRGADALGSSIAISGSVIVAGAPGADRDVDSATVNGNGAAYVFTNDAGLWSQAAKLLPREANQNNAFGYSVACSVDGQKLIVGCPGYESSAVNSGGAFAFVKSGAVWQPDFGDLWTPSAIASQSLGRSCAIRGDGLVAVIGSDYPTAEASSVYSMTYSFAVPPAPGTPLEDGSPPTTDMPGVSGPDIGDGNPDGTPSGGGTPSTGGGAAGPATTPLLPLLLPNAALVKFTLLTTDGRGGIHGTQTDGYHDRHHPTATKITEVNAAWTFLGSPDTNGDGGGDLVYFDPETRKVRVFLRDGLALAGPNSTPIETLAAGFEFGAWGDFDSDGTDDLAFINQATDTAQVWLLSESAVETSQDILLGNGSWTLQTGDLDNDNKPDLIARSPATGSLLMLTLDTASPTVAYQDAGPARVLKGVEDIDGDGSSDMLWQEGDMLYFSFLEDGVVAEERPWTMNMDEYDMVAIRDFDNNGIGDPLLIRKSDNEAVVVLLDFQSPQEFVNSIQTATGGGQQEASTLTLTTDRESGRLLTRGFVRVLQRRPLGDLGGLPLADIGKR